MGYYINPCICFGWEEPTCSRKEINWDTLDKISQKYGIDFNVFTRQTTHSIKCDTIYGIICNFDEESGSVSISDEDKNKIFEIYNLWKSKNNVEVECRVGFYLVLTGEIDGYDYEMYDFEIDT